MSRWYDEFPRFPPSRPRAAEGGVRSRSRRGAFAESWWGRRWIAVLEGFGLGARLQRGRSYARRGQVLSVEVEPGKVAASVQGSRKRPYAVRMELAPLPGTAWDRVVERLAADLHFGARLLRGELPSEVEELLDRADAPLFPRRHADLVTECSCPDWSNPCKHIAAVHYLIAEALDQDPFLLFRMRGMERETLLARLAEVMGGGPGEVEVEADADVPADSVPTDGGDALPEEAGGLPLDPDAFWGSSEPPVEAAGELVVPAAEAALLRRLGDPPFWRGQAPLLETLGPVYRAASERTLELLEEG